MSGAYWADHDGEQRKALCSLRRACKALITIVNTVRGSALIKKGEWQKGVAFLVMVNTRNTDVAIMERLNMGKEDVAPLRP